SFASFAPNASSVTPVAASGLDAVAGRLDVKVAPEEFETRSSAPFRPNESASGLGRELFGGFRAAVSNSEQGGSVFSMLGDR
ncbi:MAG: hypothetical protein VXW22_09200, partial [Pseudomonadota bacterium]|nr:hypothetical protein [Pseudomonadota bacterium]